MEKLFEGLNPKEEKLFKRLNTPRKIQDFLETIPKNFEKEGYAISSPRIVLRRNLAHCLEGALLASAILMYHGRRAILMDLKTTKEDDGHVLALFKEGRLWGAISKTNHAVLRYRDALYKNPRELAMSYFHEYFLDSGKKTLRSFAILDLGKIKKNWVLDEKNLFYVDKALNEAKHFMVVNPTQIKNLRLADPIERKAGKLFIWGKSGSKLKNKKPLS